MLPFPVQATASSGLPVSFIAAGACTVVDQGGGWLVTLTGAGDCRLTAQQPGNASYAATPDMARLVPVAKARATLALDPASLVQPYDGTPRAVTVRTA